MFNLWHAVGRLLVFVGMLVYLILFDAVSGAYFAVVVVFGLSLVELLACGG